MYVYAQTHLMVYVDSSSECYSRCSGSHVVLLVSSRSPERVHPGPICKIMH